MSPDAALEVFDLAEQALLRLKQRDRDAAKKAAVDAQLASFEAAAAELCAAFPEAAQRCFADPVLALRLLQTELRRQAAVQAEAVQLAAQLQEQQLAIAAVETRLIELEAARDELLLQADLGTEAQFAAAVANRDRLAELDLECNKLQVELLAGMTEQRRHELEALLTEHDEAELVLLREQAASQAAAAEQERADMLDKRGRIRQQLDHLLQEDAQRELLAEKQMTVAELERDAERYAVLSVSLGLIRGTRRIFEEERQPVVLRLASRFAQQLTEGRYIRILTTPSDSSIRLENAEYRIIDSTLLSRGTAEQVYLALRLALAVEAAQSSSLPLLLDDLFVNFDRLRLRAAAKLLVELAEERQLILFTCHEHIRDALQEALAQSLLVELHSA